MRVLFDQLKYELKLIITTKRLFGWTRAFLFLVLLPVVFLTKQNRPAYETFGKCEITINGRRVMLKHPDVRFIDEIIQKKCYIPNQEFFIGSDSTVVDAGANVGIFTLFASVNAESGRVFAIEPEEENFRFLKDNVVANNLSNVVLLNAALADKSGTVNLYRTNPGNNTIEHSFLKNAPNRIQTCKSITVGDLIAEYSLKQIDFMKIDIEGAEFLLFRDTKWLHCVRRIAMELHLSMGNIDKIKLELEQSGFNVSTAPAYDPGAVYIYARRSQEEALPELLHR